MFELSAKTEARKDLSEEGWLFLYPVIVWPLGRDFFRTEILRTIVRTCDTVKVYRKLRQAGVDARLQVFEALSHAEYILLFNSPESREAFDEIARFFETHLGR